MQKTGGLALALAVLGAFGLAEGAIAADMTPSPEPAISEEGHYVWFDVSAEWISLPSVSIGIIDTAGGGTDPLASLQSSPQGYGLAAAIGHRFEDGTFPAFFGSDVRLELGGSFVDADSSGSRSDMIAPGPVAVTQHLSGLENDTGLVVAIPTTIDTTLSTDYRAWEASAKLASDFRADRVTFSPWWGVFGGRTDSDHTWTQVAVSGATPFDYSADIDLNWTDYGAKVGLDTTFDLSTWLSFGIGGNVGVAPRRASLSGTEGSLIDGIPLVTTTFDSDADTIAFLANAEARLVLMPMQNLAIKGFVGVNFDDSVPGIPTQVQGGPPATPRFEPRTSYYAGGAIELRFGP